jgi:hypothetical protein
MHTLLYVGYCIVLLPQPETAICASCRVFPFHSTDASPTLTSWVSDFAAPAASGKAASLRTIAPDRQPPRQVAPGRQWPVCR